MQSFDVLCCEPLYFRPVEGDNAHQTEGVKKWMKNPRRWHARLMATWHAVARELEQRGARLIRIPPDPALPDQCFAADVAVAMNQRDRLLHFMPSNMNSPVRQQEVAHARRALEQHGYKVNLVVNSIKHEGTGDFVYIPGHNFYVQGYGPRSESGIGWSLAMAAYQNIYEVPLLVADKGEQDGLRSKETKEFHLDTVVWPLPGGYVIGHFDGMHPSTRKFFEGFYPPQRRICLSEAETDLFITNGIAVPALSRDHSKNGWTLFMPDTTPGRILRQVRKAGYGVKLFDFEPSKLSGGALHCMFNVVQKNVGGVGVVKAVTQNGLPEGVASLPPGVKFYSPKSVRAPEPRVA